MQCWVRLFDVGKARQLATAGTACPLAKGSERTRGPNGVRLRSPGTQPLPHSLTATLREFPLLQPKFVEDAHVGVAGFEEKTYEVAYCIELAVGVGGKPQVYSPGQVLEKLLGFDAASNPDPHHVIWAVLALPRPHGVQLVPPLWGASKAAQPPAVALPSYPISIFLQFKRPEYLQNPTAKQWKMWHHPYYRFKRSKEQQLVLGRLDRRLGDQAVVRYAAPAFHTVGELEAAQLTRSVITLSGHVPPTRLQRHQCWTYDAPGNIGRANPDGEPYIFERLNALLDEALSRSVAGREMQTYQPEPLTGIQEHLQLTAAACRDREPQLRRDVDSWARQLGTLDVDSRTVDTLRDFASIQSLMARTNGAWWLTGV